MARHESASGLLKNDAIQQPPSPGLALEVDGLNTFYGASHVLHDLKIQVPAGIVFGVVGRNGVGKSTMVNSIMGIVKTKSGSVKAMGQDISGWPTHRIARAGIQVVPQGRRLFPSLTVYEHLEMAARLGKGVRKPEWAYERFPSLAERASSFSNTLSGGEQSQLSISRAILANPKLLLMDEPTEGLSPIIVAEVGRLIKELSAEGVSILLVEQNLHFALDYCSTVAVMSRGAIAYQEEVAGGDHAHFMDVFMGMGKGE